MRTGTNHYSLAFTYDCIAWSRDNWDTGTIGWSKTDEPHRDPMMHAQF